MQLLPPEVMALGAQIENIPAWTANKLGLPVAELTRTKEEIQAASQQIQAMAQQQEQEQQGQAEGAMNAG
jgi:uncharacterized protein YgfB (UPF0149 family)